MKRYWLVLTLGMGFLLLLPTESFSATLCRPESPKKRFSRVKKEARAIFAGRVIEVTKEFKDYRLTFKVRFAVERAWKGEPDKEEVVFAAGSIGAPYFEEGKEYLVYAFVPKGGQRLETYACTGTGPMALSADDLKRLGKSKAPVGRMGG